MKNLLKFALVSFAVAGFVSCSDDDKNELPSVPTVATSFVNATDVEKDVILTWGKSEDPEGGAVTYDLYISKTETFTAKDIKSKGQKENTYTVQLEGHTTYYWKVVAFDSEGGESESTINSFTTKNSLPTKAVISTVKDEIVEKDLTIILEWSESTDADNDNLLYDVYASKTADFTDLEPVQKGLVGTSVRLEGMEGYTDYKFKVVSRDELDGKAESDSYEFTTQMIAGELYLREGTFIDTRDNHEYKTVEINGTTWLAENFAYLPFFSDPEADEDKCSVYGLPIVAGFGQSDFVMPTVEQAKAHENYAKYGVMYSAYCLDDIAPEGWHVATDEDWITLEKLSGMSDVEAENYGTSYRGESVHMFLGKDAGWINDVAPTDEFKLNIKPGGYCKTFEDRGENSYTYFWANTFREGWMGKSYYARAFSCVKTGIQKNTKTSAYRMYVRLVKNKE